MAVREVAEALELNVSTTHHLVNTLVWEGYLARGDDRLLTPSGVQAFSGLGADGGPSCGERSAAPRTLQTMSPC